MPHAKQSDYRQPHHPNTYKPMKIKVPRLYNIHNTEH